MQGFHYPPVDAEALRTGCCLTSIGRLVYGPGDFYPTKGHPREFNFSWQGGRRLLDFALVWITAGRGVWEADGSSRVRVGDLLYIVPGKWHRYRPDPETGWTEQWVCLRGSNLYGLTECGILPNSCIHLHSNATPPDEGRFERLFNDVLANPNANRLSWGARVLALMLEVIENASPPPPAIPEVESVVGTAERFIRENAHRSIHVGDVARACGVGRRTLERRFANAGCGTVARRIIKERVHRAEVLLTTTRLQIKDIAYTCGFESPQRMIHNFRILHHATPASFRARVP